MADNRRPTRFAGRTNTGRMTRLISVICHESRNITMRTSVTLIRLETTDDSVSVNACWAPMTSLLRRLISAPVWVRVKKAMGIFWMCSKTLERMSKMSPSPFTHLGRYPADADGQTAVGDGQDGCHQRQAEDQRLVLFGDAVVDDRSEQQRVDHPDHRIDHHQHQKPGQDLSLIH